MARPNLARNPCVRCGEESDMNCPLTDPLEGVIESLRVEGYEVHFNEIDARMARSGLCRCTNCGATGRFTYTGMKSEDSYRAFWTCRACGHWVEV